MLFWLAIGPADAAEWSLESLGAALAETTEGRVSFKERRTVSYLDQPLELEGYVVRQGDRLEKHVTRPAAESIVFEGETVKVETSEGGNHSLDLDDHPLLKGLAFALRASLRGETARLREEFDATLSGNRDDWRLTLSPSEKTVKDVLQEVQLTGSAGQVRTIRIVGENDDSSVMTLEHGEK